MKRFSFLKIILAISLVILIGTTAVFAVTQEQLDENEQQQSELEESQSKLDEALQQKKSDLEDETKRNEELQVEIQTAQDEIDVVTGEITAYNEQIKAKEKEIKALDDSIKKGFQKLKDRLKVIYMAGNASNVEIILGAKDFDDLLDKAFFVENLAKQDEELIEGLKQEVDLLEKDKKRVEENKKGAAKSKKTLDEKIESLSKLEEESQQLIEKLQIDQSKLQQEIIENEAEMEELAEEFSRMQKERASELAGGGMYDYGAAGIPVSGKKYIWPAPECDVVTAYWGDGRNHQGVDFACNGSAYGKAIVAVADGTVTVANNTDEWGYGWGYYIMIEHGDGYYTQYAHCSRIAVQAGQQVSQGEIIGYIGNTGNSFGPHLHFECWYNGTRYDPATELF